MKVNFNDTEFGLYEPKTYIEYNGRKFKCIDVPVEFDDGCKLTYRIAERDLELEMGKDFGGIGNINCDLDDTISYYAENNDMIYYILEQCCEDEEVEFLDN